MRATVAAWVGHLFDEVAAIPARGVLHALPPVEPPVHHSPIAELMAELRAEVTAQWPYLWRERRLALVVREWAQEEPSATLAQQLAADSRWQKLIFGLQLEDEARWDEWLDHFLRIWNFPVTPATIRYAKGVARGDAHAPLPARGVLVTTFVYFPPALLQRHADRPDRYPGYDQILRAAGTSPRPPLPEWGVPGGLELDVNPDFALGGSADWTTGPLLDQARAVVLRHRNWAAIQFGRHPATEVSALRAAQPTAFQRDVDSEAQLDYLAEALRGAPALLDRLRGGGVNREQLISQYLRKVYKRVSERRRERQVPVTPPADWTEIARRRLREVLASAGVRPAPGGPSARRTEPPPTASRPHLASAIPHVDGRDGHRRGPA